MSAALHFANLAPSAKKTALLSVLDGTIEDCQGTRNDILNKIYVVMGGANTNKQRNNILENILRLI